MALKFRRGTTAQKSGSLAFGEPYVNTDLNTLMVGGASGDITLSSIGTGSNLLVNDITASGNVQVAGNVTIGGTLAVTGHTTFEGVTSTGATGTGNLVYATRPTMSVTCSAFTFQDPTDNTKQANFSIAGNTTATTRTSTCTASATCSRCRTTSRPTRSSRSRASSATPIGRRTTVCRSTRAPAR